MRLIFSETIKNDSLLNSAVSIFFFLYRFPKLERETEMAYVIAVTHECSEKVDGVGETGELSLLYDADLSRRAKS